MRKKVSEIWTDLPPPETEPVQYHIREDADDMNPIEVRKKAPFQKGAVVWVEENGTAARKAVVLSVFTEYLKRNAYYIPKYRVAVLTKENKWSEKTVYKFPGDIYRGYLNMKAVPDGV